jgi:hypothetical protein
MVGSTDILGISSGDGAVGCEAPPPHATVKIVTAAQTARTAICWSLTADLMTTPEKFAPKAAQQYIKDYGF